MTVQSEVSRNETVEKDPSDMTLAELMDTWAGETDPESCLDRDPCWDARSGTTITVESRRQFNYSTRGANDGPARKYRASAPEVYSMMAGGQASVALFKPTKAEKAGYLDRPLKVRVAPQPNAKWFKRVLSMAQDMNLHLS